jgi:hypothetical protein
VNRPQEPHNSLGVQKHTEVRCWTRRIKISLIIVIALIIIGLMTGQYMT